MRLRYYILVFIGCSLFFIPTQDGSAQIEPKVISGSQPIINATEAIKEATIQLRHETDKKQLNLFQKLRLQKRPHTKTIIKKVVVPVPILVNNGIPSVVGDDYFDSAYKIKYCDTLIITDTVYKFRNKRPLINFDFLKRKNRKQ